MDRHQVHAMYEWRREEAVVLDWITHDARARLLDKIHFNDPI